MSITVGILFLAFSPANPGAPSEITQNVDLSQCIRSAMDLTVGEWKYTAVIARLDGNFRVYETESIHGKADADTWTSRSFGGDVEETETSTTRLVGDRWVPIENGELQPDQAMTFRSCEGPNELGWYATVSEYKLMADSADGQPYHVRATSTYGLTGSYFTEEITAASGELVARRSGVTIPAEPKDGRER